MTNKVTWNEEVTAKLVSLAGQSPVSQETVAQAAEALGTSARSVGSKLRKMGYEVDKVASTTQKWADADVAELTAFVNANANQLTYAEVAASFQEGKYTAKQIQGKLLNLELYALIRKADKVVTPRSFSEAEEATFVSLVEGGAFIEDLAAALVREVPVIRGKALSLFKDGRIAAIPKQRVSLSKEAADALQGLDISTMTVAEIAAKAQKTERGIKSMLSRRKLACKDYPSASKKSAE
jgi:hypothetical protein